MECGNNNEVSQFVDVEGEDSEDGNGEEGKIKVKNYH